MPSIDFGDDSHIFEDPAVLVGRTIVAAEVDLGDHSAYLVLTLDNGTKVHAGADDPYTFGLMIAPTQFHREETGS